MEQSLFRKCKSCAERLELGEFYNHPLGKHGKDHICKICRRRQTKKNRNEKIEQYRAHDRKRGSLPHRVQLRERLSEIYYQDGTFARAKDRWVKRNPEKRKASFLLNRAIRSGLISRGKCVNCESMERVHGHHDDYSKPLDVVWLCATCHPKHHAKMRENNRASTQK